MLGEVRKHKSVWTQGAKAGKQFTEQRVFRKNLHDILVKLGAILFFSVKVFFWVGGWVYQHSSNASIFVTCARVSWGDLGSWEGRCKNWVFNTSFRNTRIHCETEMRNPLTGRLMQKLCWLRDLRAEWSVLSCCCLRALFTKCTNVLISEYVEMHCNINISGKPNSSDIPKYWIYPTSLGIWGIRLHTHDK